MMLHWLLLIIPYYLSDFADEIQFSDRFDDPTAAGVLVTSDLTEASGMIASMKNQNHFWVINDSGNDANLFLIDQKGLVVHTYWIKDAINRDWEEITLKKDRLSGQPLLVIADIGDNNAIRKDVNLLFFEEPKFSDPTDTLITEYQKHVFTYEDGARDAETIIHDPVSDELFIISKREENVRIYQVPSTSGDKTGLLRFKASIPLRNVTSADITAVGDEIILKTYTSVFFWERDRQESIDVASAVTSRTSTLQARTSR